MTTPLVTPASTSPDFDHWCFISYRHLDNRGEHRQWASWLHQEIEHYEVPAELVGTLNESGEPIPARIYPVFRDEDSLAADSHLGQGILEALRGSRTMLVLCSPRSALSPYVESEVGYFQELGRANRIITALIDGEPYDPERECFPIPLRLAPNNGGILNINDGPLAADFRLADGTEGFTSVEGYRLTLINSDHPRNQIKGVVAKYEARLQLMKLKILSGILDINLEKLRDRDKAYQLELTARKAATLRRWLAAVAALTIVSVVGAGVAYFQRKEAVLQKEVAEEALAKAFVRSIGRSNPLIQPPPIEIDSLWELAEMNNYSENVRSKVMEGWMGKNGDPLPAFEREQAGLRSAVGLKSNRVNWQEAAEGLVRALEKSPEADVDRLLSLSQAFRQAGAKLDADVNAVLSERVTKRLADEIEKPQIHLADLFSLSVEFRIVAEKLKSEAAVASSTRVVVSLIERIDNPNIMIGNKYPASGNYFLGVLSSAIGEIIGFLEPNQGAAISEKMLEKFVSRISSDESFTYLGEHDFTDAPAKFARYLKPSVATDLTYRLVNLIENPEGLIPGVPRRSSQAIAEFAANLESGAAVGVADHLVKLIESINRSRAPFDCLTKALSGVAPKLERQVAVGFANRLANALESSMETETTRFSQLTEAFGCIVPRLDDEASASLSARVMKRLMKVLENFHGNDVDDLLYLSDSLIGLPEHLDADANAALSVKLVELLTKALEDPKLVENQQLWRLAETIEGIAGSLDPVTASDTAERLVRVMQNPQEVLNDRMTSLERSLTALSGKLEAATVYSVADRLVKALENPKEVDGTRLSSLKSAFKGVSERLSSELASGFAKRLAKALESPEEIGSYRLDNLYWAFLFLSGKLEDHESANLAENLSKAMLHSDGYQLMVLSSAFKEIAGKLRNDYGTILLRPVAERMIKELEADRPPENNDVILLSEVYTRIADTLGVKESTKLSALFFDHFVLALEDNGEDSAVSNFGLAQSLVPCIIKLAPEARAAATIRLFVAFRDRPLENFVGYSIDPRVTLVDYLPAEVKESRRWVLYQWFASWVAASNTQKAEALISEDETRLVELCNDLSIEQLVDALKWPFCGDKAQTFVLAAIERKFDPQVGAKFYGDIWRFVAMAPLLGIKNLNTPTHRPSLEGVIKEVQDWQSANPRVVVKK